MSAFSMQDLVEIVVDPGLVADRPASFWTGAMPRLRRSGLLGRLAVIADPQWRSLPVPVRDQFQAAFNVAERQWVAIGREIAILGSLLEDLPVRPILLKGAAYQALALPNAHGRLSSDVDIMVPEAMLDAVEQRLLAAGFVHVKRSSYDQRYYREWSHELPPLRHPERGSFVDLHRSILAPTSRLRLDPELLFDAAQPIPGTAFAALAGDDLILHSVCHLLTDGEFPHGLRDLFDIRELLVEFVPDDESWSRLVGRAEELHLERLLQHAVAALERWTDTRAPAETRQRLRAAAPAWPLNIVMEQLIDRAVVGWGGTGVLDSLAASLMLVRSHLLRMPLRLLIPHLARKGWRRAVADGGS